MNIAYFRWLASALVALGILVAATPAKAQFNGHPLGLGLHFGSPNGITGKFWLDGTNAVQTTIGYQNWYAYHSYKIGRGPAITADWVKKVATLVPAGAPQVRFGFYVGAGGALLVDSCYDYDNDGHCEDRGELAFRVPLGLAAYFPVPRIEAYVELTPAINLLPDFGMYFMGLVGGRFYF